MKIVHFWPIVYLVYIDQVKLKYSTHAGNGFPS